MDFRTHDIARLHDEIAALRITPADIAEHCIAQVSRQEAALGASAGFAPARLRPAA